MVFSLVLPRVLSLVLQGWYQVGRVLFEYTHHSSIVAVIDAANCLSTQF
jgi:hypothetical protein